MKAMLAQLSPNEENSLRRIGADGVSVLDPRHGRRLLHLELIEWRDRGWRLTAVGRKRYDTLFTPSQKSLPPRV
jgi:hypothetical protein